MVNLDSGWFFRWYHGEATEEQKQLHDRYMLFDEELFDDMIFGEGSSSRKLIKCKSKSDSGEWVDDNWDLPFELEYYDCNWFRTQIENLNGAAGQFNSDKLIITISPECIDSDSVLLHEMIHAHESIINNLPMYYHDTLIWALYSDLRNKIYDLDKAISQHAHLLNEWIIYSDGGCHDLLFLLKSFDLDIRQGYPLGTVFGYGAIDDFKYLKYDADFTKLTPSEAAALEAAEAEIERGETVSDDAIDWDAD